MSKRRRQLVQIDWIDSKGAEMRWEDWSDLEPLKPVLCRSVGYLLHDGKRYKTLAMAISDTQILGRMTIPASAIRRMRRIR